jgi:hypothetical protein
VYYTTKWVTRQHHKYIKTTEKILSRISLWREGVHTNDYKFIDRRISEMFTLGGTGVYVHKYLGPAANISANGATPEQPANTNQSILNIQDLLFLENRDRKYDPDVYNLRGHYQVSDNSFDLSQFGLFLQTGTLFMVFHINDMIDMLGRKIINGDVFELPHLKDYNSLDTTVPVALKRFYVVSDCTNASEGFSQTWWPHLWRCKLNPLTDSQEYKDILNQLAAGDNTTANLASVSSTLSKYQQINDAIIAEAELNVPLSGYDASHLYYESITPIGTAGDPFGLTADAGLNPTADNSYAGDTADSAVLSTDTKVQGYLTADGSIPNGAPCAVGIAFPNLATLGDFCLRTDYFPNRLFRYNGNYWVKMEDNVRTDLTPGSNNKTQRSLFVNDTATFTDGTGTYNVRQSLSKAFTPEADNS